jgi:PAS domain S-box-containing protein
VPNARVLLADDSEGADEIVSGLESAGNRVIPARSVSDALVKLRNNRVDVVVSEYRFEDENGIELVREIERAQGQTPVIMYTAHGDEQVASLAIDAGVSAYIPKTESSIDRLAETVSELSITQITSSDRDDLPDPTAETIIRAVDEAPIGITISDPSLPDNPLIYLNSAYEEITGYSEEFVLGRNCRFLQGPDTKEEPIEEMSKAVGEAEPVSVELLNYREDGTPFWNRVTIAPLTDDDGEVTHYVGFQEDVTDRKEAEAIAQQRADSLREERQALERVLGRVSGLINDISHVLVNAATREEIEREVCAEIASTEGYSHAWIGQSQAAGPGIRVRVDEEGEQRVAELTGPGEGGATVFDDVLETGTAEVLTDAEELPAEMRPDGFDATTVAVIPLSYRRTTYGVLAVYAERSEVLDRRECKIFEAIGQMVASGINAIETKQVLTGDRVTELGFEITDESFPLIELASAVDGTVNYNGSTINQDSAFRVFVTMCEPEMEFERFIENRSTITDGFVISRQDGTIAASVEFEETDLFRELAEYGATLRDLSVSGNSGTAQMHIDLPVEGDVRSVLTELEAAYDGVNLIRQHEREREPRPTAEFVATVGDRLTDRQYTALETAYLSDYFEFPRPVSGEELAESMGISRQTYHQHLRAAQQKLLDEFFDSDHTGT